MLSQCLCKFPEFFKRGVFIRGGFSLLIKYGADALGQLVIVDFGLEWGLWVEADLHFARAVYARLYDGRVFLMKDILSLLEREPSLTSMNSGIPRNAGWLRSIEADRPAGRMQKREL